MSTCDQQSLSWPPLYFVLAYPASQQTDHTLGWTMRMITSEKYLPIINKHEKKDRTFIINKQAPARPTALHNMIKRDILLSEVSAWLLQYVHIAWCDGPLCNIAQTNRTPEENCDWTSKESMLQVEQRQAASLQERQHDNMVRRAFFPTGWHR